MIDKKRNFLKSIHQLILQIEDDERLDSGRKLEVLAFSILATIDGESIDCGPFVLREVDEAGNEGEDIGGNLHNEFKAIKNDLKITVVPNIFDDHAQVVEEGSLPKETLMKQQRRVDFK